MMHVTREGVLTIETETPHPYRQGDSIFIEVQGIRDRWLVTSVPHEKKLSAIRDRRSRKQRRAQESAGRKAWLKSSGPMVGKALPVSTSE